MVQVLALLFMARADVGYTVRQAAVHVWKTIVTNTPRTTGEILKTLMDQIITSLGHPSKPIHHTTSPAEAPTGRNGSRIQSNALCGTLFMFWLQTLLLVVKGSVQRLVQHLLSFYGRCLSLAVY